MTKEKEKSRSQQRREGRKRKRQSGKIFTRRDLLKIGTCGLVALTAEEVARRFVIPNLLDDKEGKNELDPDFVGRIEGVMGINKSMSRVQIVQMMYNKTHKDDPDWLKNGKLGSGFVNNRGQIIEVRFDRRGEPNFVYPDYNRPSPEQIQNATQPDTEIYSQGDKYVVLYGERADLDNRPVDTDPIFNFMEEYFSDSVVDSRVLHLNYLQPGDPGFKPVTIEHQETKLSFDDRAIAQVRNHTIVNPNTSPKVQPLRVDVLLNLRNIKSYSKFWGVSEEDAITSALSNELFNHLESQATQNDIEQSLQTITSNEEAYQIVNRLMAPDNEAPSGLVSLLAQEDTEWASIFLGGEKYKEAVAAIINSLE